jgi:tRNA pseudouridine38-40 synthase
MSLHYEPDYVMMNLAAQQLLGMHDFTSFSKLHTDVKTNFCNVISAQWVNIEDDLWRFEITADRFLRNMVRAIVGTLLEVGRIKITIEDFIEATKSFDSSIIHKLDD